MAEVIQFKYGNDNLGYLIHNKEEAVAIDAGDPHFVLDYIKGNKLRLKEIRNTHSHIDHIVGNRYLAAESEVSIINSIGGKVFSIGGEQIKVISTPGHTRDSVCFQGNRWIITGDTIFIANVGNCNPRLIRTFMNSLKKLLQLPDDTIIYPGHDYTDRSLKRAQKIDPNNIEIRRFQEAYKPPPVCSTISDEKRINPYLRTDQPALITYLRENNKDVNTPLARFKSFLELE